ncbi:MAG: LCP family protein [Anaerolineaceae bacterium]|jgi:LCP family protein required for cell wall assembly|nr:LCP family protein [Anaerolineaceae bacterium]MDD4042935.1 LCP family protein [Anaerolineaceae bacterium]MDD4577351.1 LCP family protein [Anaerolineaceae bacterium]
MSDTQPMHTDQNGQGSGTPRRKISRWQIIGLVAIGLILILVSVWFTWLKPFLQKPISDPLNLPSISTEALPTSTDLPTEAPTLTATLPEPTATATPAPVCGDTAEWTFLLVGIDYRGNDYLYGLADVIRLARVDFTTMTINMVALPRDMVVNAPDGLFKEENPIKINQGYLLGSPGWTGDPDAGSGANSLARVIQHNFGVTPDHYAVVNFNAVRNFINGIGGVEVTLPQEVYDPDPSLGYFPAGTQTLDGERALDLSRIRTNYSDGFRVGNQSIIIKGVIKKFLQPENLVKFPDLVADFYDTFLTDLSIEQITTLGVCFLQNFDLENYNSTQIPEEMLLQDFEFIPSNFGSSFVYRWDQTVVDWIHQNLLSQEAE